MNRRSLFKSAVGRGAELGLGRVESVLNSLPHPFEPTRPLTPAVPVAPRLEAELPSRACGTEELRELVVEHGLESRAEEVAALSRRSARLAPISPASLPGGPGATVGPPSLLALDLDAARAAGVESALPLSGTLVVFPPLEGPDDETVSAPVRISTEVAAPSAAPHGELVLPRAWSNLVEALGLDDTERESWDALRDALAARQGLSAWKPGERRPIHRLLGYPDDSRGDMPAALAARPGAAPAEEWRLLLQLGRDESAGWDLGRSVRRMYFWAERERLAGGNLSSVVAFSR